MGEIFLIKGLPKIVSLRKSKKKRKYVDMYNILYGERYIGSVALYNYLKHVEIAISIVPTFRNRGVGSWALQETAKKSKIFPVIAFVNPKNKASRRMCEKAGFRCDECKFDVPGRLVYVWMCED